MRIPKVERERIAGLLDIGVPKNVIHKRYCPVTEEQKPILLEDINRIDKMYCKPHALRKDKENVILMLQRPEVKSYCFDKKGWDFSDKKYDKYDNIDVVRKKYRSAEQDYFVRLSDLGAQYFCANPTWEAL